jgi:16S rRNA processing protein RimM
MAAELGIAAPEPENSRPPADLVELGVLRGPYGLKGWSHVQSYAGDPGVMLAVRQWWLLGPSGRQPAVPASGPLRVTGVRPQGDGLIAKWDGCDDPEQAQRLRGWRVAVSRAAFPRLPDGQHYWIDLLGARVVNRRGVDLGCVRGMRNNGAHDVLEVERTGQDAQAPPELLIPVVAAYVDAIDAANRRIDVDWDENW